MASSGATKMYGANRSDRPLGRPGAAGGAAADGAVAGGGGATVLVRRDAMAQPPVDRVSTCFMVAMNLSTSRSRVNWASACRYFTWISPPIQSSRS